jgi:hypothetical protein
LAKSGEMVLDDKGRVKAERLGFDIVVDPLAEALARVGQLGAGLRPPRLGAAEESKPHVRAPIASVGKGKVEAAICKMLVFYRFYSGMA